MIKKILWSLYLGFVLYSIIMLYSGAAGYSNMKALNYFELNLRNHVEDLQIKSDKLNDEINRLSNDQDRLKLALRPLGYIESGQKMIKILDNNSKNSLYDMDYQYNIPNFKQNSNTILFVSVLFAVILFVISLFIGVISDTIKRK